MRTEATGLRVKGGIFALSFCGFFVYFGVFNQCASKSNACRAEIEVTESWGGTGGAAQEPRLRKLTGCRTVANGLLLLLITS